MAKNIFSNKIENVSKIKSSTLFLLNFPQSLLNRWITQNTDTCVNWNTNIYLHIWPYTAIYHHKMVKKNLERKIRYMLSVSWVQFLVSSIKFLYQLTDLSTYLIQRPQVILLEQVGLFRNLQDKTVPMSSNQQAYNILPLAELNSFQEMKDTK